MSFIKAPGWTAFGRDGVLTERVLGGSLCLQAHDGQAEGQGCREAGRQGGRQVSGWPASSSTDGQGMCNGLRASSPTGGQDMRGCSSMNLARGDGLLGIGSDHNLVVRSDCADSLCRTAAGIEPVTCAPARSSFQRAHDLQLHFHSAAHAPPNVTVRFSWPWSCQAVDALSSLDFFLFAQILHVSGVPPHGL